MFQRLAKDLDEVKHGAFVLGRVIVPASGRGQVYVVRSIETADRLHPVELERLLPTADEYSFLLETGARHRILAFQDTNGDRMWEPGEPLAVSAVVNDFAPQRVMADLVLTPVQQSPGIDLDLRASAVRERRPIAAGEVTTLADPAFDEVRAADGMWRPLTTAKQSGFGVYFLEPYDPARIPVLFIHGIEGSPRDFRKMIAALDHSHYQAWVVSYPSGIRLPIVADLVRDILVGLHDRLAVRHLVLVGHSVGGIVSRSLVLDLVRRGEAGFLDRLITLSTPYAGIAAAGQGVRYAPTVVPSWMDATPGSEFLRSIEAPLPRTLPFDLFFSYGRRSATVGGNNDGVVAIDSQLSPYARKDAARIFACEGDHVGILSHPETLKQLQELLEPGAAP